MTLRRWLVVRGDLNPVVGSEQGGVRPLLVVSHDSVNRSLPIVTVLPITSRKPGRKIYWPEVLLTAGTAGLPRDSIVMAHQIRTLSKARVLEICGDLDEPDLRRRIASVLRRYLPVG
ncbi:MAG: type II toxin-antitoxin system PemK/MazF family toxin [Armatimonadetes bacterium]|nr:type II toxin-antitoxin system PemK/MazF family toxin [Armatimonadota bacterium]